MNAQHNAAASVLAEIGDATDGRRAGRPIVSAVVPCLNEEASIGTVVGGLRRYADEVIVVDDGSSDSSATVAASAGAVVISHPRVHGYNAALRSGFARAQGDIVVVVDGDGEFPTSCIPDLLAPIIAGDADMVQARREHPVRPSESLLNFVASCAYPVGDSGTGMRAIRGELVTDLRVYGLCICGTLALEVAERGGRIAEVPVALVADGRPRRPAYKHILQFWLVLWFAITGAAGRIGRE